MGATNSSNILPSSFASTVPTSRNQENSNEIDFEVEENLRCVDGVNEDAMRSDVRSSTYNVTGEPRPQMTYAARTTNWRGLGEGSGSPYRLQHRENLELSEIILQLAKANQQLAGAHTTALAQLEGLYLELQRERSSQKFIPNGEGNNSTNATSRKRLTTTGQDTRNEQEEDNDTRRNLERRLDRLESVLACRFEEQSSFLNERVPVRVEVDKPGHDQQFSRISRHNSSRERSINGNAQDVPVDSERIERSSGNSGVMDTRLTSCNARSRLDKTLDRRIGSNDEEEHVERLTNDEIIKFLEEIRALKADKVEYLSTNERLNENLKEQKVYTEKLCKDYEILREQCEKLKSSLDERRQRHEKLLKDFDLTKSEMGKMLKEITSFQLEKDTAEARISSLEGDLKRALFEKERFKDTENEEIAKLKVQLAKEIDDKKKHAKALEDALNEIQRLKDAAKTESNNIQETKDDIDYAQSTDEVSETSTNDRATNLDLFKKELILKREARQRAIATVSSEMERLRQELEAEKEAHSETSRVLDLLRSTENNLQNDSLGNGSDKSNKMSKSGEGDCDKDEMLSRRIEAQRLSSILKVSDELRNNIRFQMEKIDDLRYQLESEPDQHRYQIRCLTDVSNKTRDTLKTRERRANELKDYLARNLARLNDRSFLDFKDDVSAECERQLESINSLRSLYNERLRVLSELKDAAVKELIDVKENLKHSSKECESLEEDLKKAEEKIDAQDTEISNLESQLGLTKADCRDLQNQMSLINSLFTQMLLGASSADMDLDRLSQLLQENRDLITDIARDDGTEAAALPKLLLDLVEQVDGNKGSQKRNEDDQQHEEIAHNLPKVWRVLLELLSCHAAASHHQNASEASSSDSNSCYKSVDTPSGPKLVISVSKTYIHLKELILEKKHLEKEMNRMKQLNTHLESKLGEQEKRLSAVTAELSKTWNVVGRMQAQHHQLHTHEKILRYELQQKRKMLQELKLELEYCREKWESARQKNTNTELEWRSLRREFAARKMLSVHDSVNNSAESGFSDERGDDSDDDDGVDGRVRMGLTRRTRKESPKTSPVDVGLEQQTKTELPDSEASSSSTLTIQVPASAQETELNKVEVVGSTLPMESTNTQESDLVSEVFQQTLDPLDQALTTVIRNLIRIEDDTESSSDEFASRENITLPFMRLGDSARSENDLEGSNDDLADQKECPSDNDDNEGKENTDIESCCPESNTSETCSNVETDNIMTLSSNSKLDPEEIQDSEKILKSIDEAVPIGNISNDTTENVVNPISVFSIGPFPVNRNMHSPNQIFTPFFNDSSETNSITNDVSASNQRETESSELQKDTKEIDNSIVSLDTKESLESTNEVSENTEKEPKPKSEATNANPEQVLTAREDRLKRLEEQAQWLMKKMNATSRRGSALSTRLEALHETYGGEPSAPVPDVLQNRTTRSTSSSSISQVAKSSTDDDTKNVQTPTENKEADEPSSDNKT